MSTPRAISISGITWNHSRGHVPLVALAQRFMDVNSHVSIEWHKRSLKDFGDLPIEMLAEKFDLLIIDHPFVGYAASHPVLLPLDQILPASFIADQQANSVGASYRSYVYEEHLWALPVDAATPVSGWRADLMARHDATPPRTWDELVALARRGLVALPAVATDAAMHTWMLCLAISDNEPFSCEDHWIDLASGTTALELLRELTCSCSPACLERNPIQTWHAMVSADEIAYCPFAYGYSNYGRRDYTSKPLQFGGLVSLTERPLRSVLGGAGLAISSRVQDPEQLKVVTQYVMEVCSPAAQAGLYTISGGQPGHRQGWVAPDLDLHTNGFFSSTLPTLDAAWLRPRYDGYSRFQDQAGAEINNWLRIGGNARQLYDRIDALYRNSLNHA